ncbi:MAG: ribosome silencing factor [Spirochaetes bacterium]|nr:ribosome silencing factor [Spirochaetota bacterium]
MTNRNKRTKTKLSIEPEILTLMKGCKKILDDKKASDIIFLDLREVNSYLDYFVICTGNSILHCKALAREVHNYFVDMGRKERSRTTTNSPWIVLDYNDIIIHIFTKETREFYQLERLWADARQIDID